MVNVETPLPIRIQASVAAGQMLATGDSGLGSGRNCSTAADGGYAQENNVTAGGICRITGIPKRDGLCLLGTPAHERQDLVGPANLLPGTSESGETAKESRKNQRTLAQTVSISRFDWLQWPTSNRFDSRGRETHFFHVLWKRPVGLNAIFRVGSRLDQHSTRFAVCSAWLPRSIRRLCGCWSSSIRSWPFDPGPCVPSRMSWSTHSPKKWNHLAIRLVRESTEATTCRSPTTWCTASSGCSSCCRTKRGCGSCTT